MKTVSIRRPLSARANEILQLLGRGLQTKQIAERLGIGAGTVQSYFVTLRATFGGSIQDVRRIARQWESGRLQIVVPIKRVMTYATVMNNGAQGGDYRKSKL